MDINREDTLLLIEEYRKHQVLWNPKDKWYYNKLKKCDAWEQIAKKFEIDIDDAKKKMSSLLGSFRREKNKVKQSMGTGKGTSEIYTSEWFAFDAFAFLMDKDEPRKRINTEETSNITIEFVNIEDSNISQSDIIIEDSVQSNKENQTESNKQDNISETPSPFSTPIPHKKRIVTRNKKIEDPRIEEAYNILKQPVERHDFISTYCKYFEEKLRQFEPGLAKLVIHKTNQLIFESETNSIFNMSSPESSRISLTPSPSPSPSLFDIIHGHKQQSRNIVNTIEDSQEYYNSPLQIRNILR